MLGFFYGRTTGLVFVGASLLANGGAERDLPQAKIRLQGSSYKDNKFRICRGQPAGEWWRSTWLASGKDSLAGKLLQRHEISNL